MATGYLSQYAAGTNTAFIQRVQMSILVAAQAIISEAANTVNHNNRVRCAAQIANNSGQFALQFATVLAAQSYDVNSTDAQIDTGVSTVFNTIAGVL